MQFHAGNRFQARHDEERVQEPVLIADLGDFHITPVLVLNRLQPKVFSLHRNGRVLCFAPVWTFSEPQ